MRLKNFIIIVSLYVNYVIEIILVLKEEHMDLNQPLPEEPSEYSASHYSAMGSIHPTNIHEGSEALVGGNRGAPKVMPVDLIGDKG